MRRNPPWRTYSSTEKIEKETTGLKSALFVHVERIGGPLGPVTRISFSHKDKDEGTLDNILSALGDTVTAILRGEETK